MLNVARSLEQKDNNMSEVALWKDVWDGFPLMEFIPSLDAAYAHLIPMTPKTEATSKQAHSHYNHLVSTFLEKSLLIYTGFLIAYLKASAQFFIAFFTHLAP